MKKQWLVLTVLALALGAAGCRQDQKPASSTSSTTSSARQPATTTSPRAKHSSASQHSVLESSKPTASSRTGATPAANSRASAPTASSRTSRPAASQPAPPDERLTVLNRQLQAALPGALLPQRYPTGAAQLNANYTGDANNYSIFYAPGPTALAFPAASVNANAATVVLRKQTFASAQAAEARINYQPVVAANVAIGDHLKAEQQGAAGSTYTTWLEGRWSLTVQASNLTGEDGLPLAKQAVALLAKESLPIPAGHGAVYLRPTTGGSRLNTVTWRRGNALYTANGSDALTLLQVITSLK